MTKRTKRYSGPKLRTLRGLPEDTMVFSWQIDWENFDWSDVWGGDDAPGTTRDPNLRVVWPMRLKPTQQIVDECVQRRRREAFLADFAQKYRDGIARRCGRKVSA